MIYKTEEFIEKAKIIHGDRYDYSRVIYKKAMEKVEIICKEHGVFLQMPSKHLSGQGCRKCWNENRPKRDASYVHPKRTEEDFISRAVKIHGDVYDYSLVKYKGCCEPINIICKKHGLFKITPSSHLSGRGCQMCSKETVIEKQTLTQEEAINNMIKTHGYKYDYSLVKYVRGKDKIKIICPIHGVFEQTYFDHANKGNECPYCSNKKVHALNCIGYTRPDLLKYFVNIEDSEKYTEFSSKKIKVKCPDCGDVRDITISDMSMYGFNCHRCNDNISLPEKFCYNLLKELGTDFIKEKVFDWSNHKRYDFYIQSLNMLIEVHGEQHYTQSFKSLGGKTLEEEMSNDVYKEELAKSNKIEKYIVVDCRNSDFTWLKDNFIKALSGHFNLENIDWENVYLNSNKSMLVYICEQWNKYSKTHTTKDLANLLGLNQSMIASNIKRGVSLGLCKYDKSYENKKSARKISIPVVQLDLDGNLVRELSSCREGLNYGFDNSSISKCCKGKINSYKGYIFKYKKDYEIGGTI